MRQNQTSPVAQSRVIRVFVSSTFRDMRGERDELIKHIFPQLRKLCESRSVTWIEVDLRWGISDEQKAEDKVLPICLDEIARCRPYFIGLLGERYGWVPERISEELVLREPWLNAQRDRSVTELEIIHGVFGTEAMHQRAFFYFRDQTYLDRLPPGADRKDFVCETPASRVKLDQLKQRIRNARDEEVCALRENYRDEKELGQWILEDFTRLIDDLYPAEQPLDPLGRQAADHDAFAQSRTNIYIPRQEYLEVLDAHAIGTAPPLVVRGESGVGKSALLANWAVRYRAQHPDDLLLMHFIGAAPESADWATIIQRILGEVKRRGLGLDGEIPDERAHLRIAFADWLDQVDAKVVLVLDGLNQLEDREGALDLTWLPASFPASVRFIVSSLPGPSLNELEKRGWPSLVVGPLQRGERENLIVDYLGQYRKRLNQQQLESITGAAQTDNPLFLRTLLEELRIFGSHEQLNTAIAHYLAAKDAGELYQRIFQRYETDYGAGNPRFVAETLSLLWAARRGLTESEILDLLSGSGDRLPRAQWTPLYLALEPLLTNRTGYLSFSHGAVREAVRFCYLSDENGKRVVLEKLATYFLEHYPLRPRCFEETPWHLVSAGNWERLVSLLATRLFLLFNWQRRSEDVLFWWRKVEANSPLRAATAYREQLESPGKHPATDWIVARVMESLGQIKTATETRTKLLAGSEDPLSEAANRLALARLSKKQGDVQTALEHLEHAERLYRETSSTDHVVETLVTKAEFVLLSSRDSDQAWEIAIEAYELAAGCRVESKVNALGSLMFVATARDDIAAVKRAGLVRERICRENNFKNQLASTLSALAIAFDRLDESHLALATIKECENLYRELEDSANLAVTLMNYSSMLQGRDNKASLIKIVEAEKVAVRAGHHFLFEPIIEQKASVRRLLG